MTNNNFSYPHPVLGNEDDMSGIFELTMTIRRNDDRMIELHSFEATITNEYINSLILNHKAVLLLKIYCSSTLYTRVEQLNTFSILIDENDIAGTLEVSPYIVANCDIGPYYHTTFHSDYGDQSFEINKNEILGIGGKTSISIPKSNEKLGMGNIFSFSAGNINEPISFSFESDQIKIVYPIAADNTAIANFLFNRFPWIAYNILIVPALAEAFKHMDIDENYYSGYEWFTVLNQMMPKGVRRYDEHFLNAQTVLGLTPPLVNAYNEINPK
jgi:hypothetical protein